MIKCKIKSKMPITAMTTLSFFLYRTLKLTLTWLHLINRLSRSWMWGNLKHPQILRKTHILLYMGLLLFSAGIAFSQDTDTDDDFNWTALEGLDEEVIKEPAEDVKELPEETLDIEDGAFDWTELGEGEPTSPSAPLPPSSENYVGTSQGGDSVVAPPAPVVVAEPDVPALPVEPIAPAPVVVAEPDVPALPVEPVVPEPVVVAEPDVPTLLTTDHRPQTTELPTPAASQAYGELLRENLGLRKKIVDLSEASENARNAVRDAISEKEKLVEIVQKLEISLTDMTGRIETIKTEKAKSSENLDRTVELEELLAKVEREKTGLLGELEIARRKAADTGSKIKAGSDLFKEIEKDNANLKSKLVDLEIARRKAKAEVESAKVAAEKKTREADRLQAKAKRELDLIRKKEDRLNDELDEAKSKDKDRKKIIDKMLKQIPDLEKELVKLTAEVVEAAVVSGAKDRDLELLRSELQRRDHRFVKAERMAELLEQARREVKMVGNVEKRDMHYNMAVVYAKEGKVRDAEREYLRALKLDPTDPAVHYNLGILYDDEFDKKYKAALHYKKYIQLAPFSTDVDIVKQWLLDIEMSR